MTLWSETGHREALLQVPSGRTYHKPKSAHRTQAARMISRLDVHPWARERIWPEPGSSKGWEPHPSHQAGPSLLSHPVTKRSCLSYRRIPYGVERIYLQPLSMQSNEETLIPPKGGEYLLGRKASEVNRNGWLHKRTCLFPTNPPESQA